MLTASTDRAFTIHLFTIMSSRDASPSDGARPAAKRPRRERRDIRARYREILGMPDLSDGQIDTMRANLSRLAETLCEHIWGKRFH